MVSSKTISGLFITLSIVSIVLLGWYWRQVQRNENISTYTTLVPDADVETFLDAHLQNYLEDAAEISFGGKAFCRYTFFGQRHIGYIIEAYVSAGCQEYYVNNGKLLAGTGEGGPRVVLVTHTTDGFRILYINRPGDGSLYTNDLMRMFPPEVYTKYQNYIANQTQVQADNKKLRDEALLYFSQVIGE